MLTKGHAPDSSSWHAQGGIAGAIGDDDTAELHAIDTERAGRELCRRVRSGCSSRKGRNASAN
jgi:L-aspartate oxidase